MEIHHCTSIRSVSKLVIIVETLLISQSVDVEEVAVYSEYPSGVAFQR